MEVLSDGISETKSDNTAKRLSDEYDQISKIIENIRGIDILQAQEMHRREFQGLQRREAN